MSRRNWIAALCCLIALASPLWAKDKIIVARNADAKTLDPHTSTDVPSNDAMYQMFEGLVSFKDQDGRRDIFPALAERWERPDPLTYRFYLRKGVKFHNGEELTADDVVYSFKRTLTPVAAAQKAYADLLDPNGFKVIDRYTCELRTKQPTTVFMALLTQPFGLIMNQKAVEDAGDNVNRQPVGTGPFKLVEWIKGDRLVMERFDDYWGEKPRYKDLIIRCIPESTTRGIELETGNVDLIYDVPANDMARLKEEGKVIPFVGMGTSMNYLGLNLAKENLKDPRVREAIDLAIDKEGINAVVFQGYAVVPAGPFPSYVRYAPKGAQPRPYDPERAMELLKEAGYENGFTLKIWMNDKKERIDIGTIIQAQLAEVGITVDLQVLEWGAYLENLKAGRHEAFILGWSTTVPDPYMFLYRPFHSSTIGITNRAWLDDPEIDRLLDLGAVTPDGPERAAIYEKLWKDINAQTPWCYIAIPDKLYAKAKGLKGTEDLEKGLDALFATLYYEN